MLSRLLRWFRRQKPAIPSTWDINQALRWAYQTGVANGEKHQPPIVYHRFCEKHQLRLQEMQPGVFVCPSCRSLAYPQQDTDPLLIILRERPFQAYRQALREADVAELHTERHRVMRSG